MLKEKLLQQAKQFIAVKYNSTGITGLAIFLQ